MTQRILHWFWRYQYQTFYKIFQLSECNQGYYTDRTTNTCEPCPIGTFNYRPEAESCIPCAKGQSTLQEGSKYRIHCLPGNELHIIYVLTGRFMFAQYELNFISFYFSF